MSLEYIKTLTNQFFKWAKDWKEDIQIATKEMKRCSPSLFVKEIQIKTTMRYNYTLIRMARICGGGGLFRASPPAYGSSQARGQIEATAASSRHICDLHNSSGQCQILNPLREARD